MRPPTDLRTYAGTNSANATRPNAWIVNEQCIKLTGACTIDADVRAFQHIFRL